MGCFSCFHCFRRFGWCSAKGYPRVLSAEEIRQLPLNRSKRNKHIMIQSAMIVCAILVYVLPSKQVPSIIKAPERKC